MCPGNMVCFCCKLDFSRSRVYESQFLRKLISCWVSSNPLRYASVASDIPNIRIKLGYLVKNLTTSRELKFTVLSTTGFSHKKGITYPVMSYLLLKVMSTLQEKLLKKMDPLWRSTQEMQNNLNQEISKIHSLMVGI